MKMTYKKIAIGILLVFLTGCEAKEVDMISKSQAIEIAQNEAIKLGYDIKILKVTTNSKASNFEIDFEPSVNQLGGSVKITVSRKTGKVENILRGQ
jgi:hypothetical protein